MLAGDLFQASGGLPEISDIPWLADASSSHNVLSVCMSVPGSNILPFYKATVILH